MIFIAYILPFACFMAEALPPADQAPTLQPKSFDLGNLPNDLLYAIAEFVKDPRDSRSYRLAISIADVPTKEINDHVMEIVRKGSHVHGKTWTWQNLDLGRIWTSQSPFIEHYKAIEGKLNPRTNKPFKLDSIIMNSGWQDDPVWQSWNWTNVKEVIFQRVAANPKHSKLPLTRLRGIKTFGFNYAFAKPGHDAAVEVLKQNPDVENLMVSFDPIMPSQLAQTVCSLKNLKDLALSYSTDFVEEVLTCLPANNDLKKLKIDYSPRERGLIVATPDIAANLDLNELLCDGCDSSWIDLQRIQKLTWAFDKNHNETVRVLEKLKSMKPPLPYLRLVQYRETFEPRAFQLIREIAPRFNEMEIHYPSRVLSEESLLKELPDFHAGKKDGEYLKKGKPNILRTIDNRIKQ